VPVAELGLELQPDADRLTLPRFLEDVTARHAGRLALRAGDRSLGYRELDEEARRLARGLLGAGVVKGARIALLMANRPEWVSAMFAVSLLGGVLVPVNTYATADERDYILRHSDASLLLLQHSLLEHAFLDELTGRHPELLAGEPGRLRCEALPQLRRVVCLGLEQTHGGVEAWSSLESASLDVAPALVEATASEVTPADDAMLIYTSGTTAHPKGVLHLQRAPVTQSWRFAEFMRLCPDDRVFTAQPFFWSAGIAMSLGATLAAGATLLLQETFEPGAALERIESERATTLHAWPHQEKAMADHPSAPQRDLSRLRKIEFASPLAPLAGLQRDEWGTYGAYGLSETFTLFSSLPADADADLRQLTNGRPLPGMSVRIVDPATGQPLPGESKGEIAVKGVTLMRGYYKVEPEGYLDDAGFFRTHDGGWIDASGHLHWTGRLSNLIKTGGANVSPLEIESALAGHPALASATVVGIPHPTLGEAVVLCAVPAPGRTLDEARLRKDLRAKLASYKVPRRVLCFRAEELSYTGSQKIQLDSLRERALERLEAEHAEIAGFVYGPEEGGAA
jgi:fatty-acyl-CoA synthase